MASSDIKSKINARTTRTITMTNRAPVRIAEDDWPIIASATGTSCTIADPALRQQSIRRGECDEYFLRVRQHADGRILVNAVLRATDAAWRQPANGIDRRTGELHDPGADVAAIIRRVGIEAGIPDWIIMDCIADLPADDI